MLETLLPLITIIAPYVGPAFYVAAGLFIEHWKGPLATFLRNRRKQPNPDGTPAPAPAPLDIDKLIPDDPNSAADDVVRAILKAVIAAQAGGAPVNPEKLSLIQRLLALFPGAK
jgi:hypothetical protein